MFNQNIRGLSSVLGNALISAVASQAILALDTEWRIVATGLAIALVVLAIKRDIDKP